MGFGQLQVCSKPYNVCRLVIIFADLLLLWFVVFNSSNIFLLLPIFEFSYRDIFQYLDLFPILLLLCIIGLSVYSFENTSMHFTYTWTSAGIHQKSSYFSIMITFLTQLLCVYVKKFIFNIQIFISEWYITFIASYRGILSYSMYRPTI